MVRLLLLCSLMLSESVFATQVFQYRDESGQPIFSDTKPEGPHQSIDIEIKNDYKWHKPDAPLKYTKPKSRKKKNKRKKKTQRLSLAELQGKCESARYRYQRYRGTRNSSDWGKYQATLTRYASKRDYWCSRVLKRK